MWKWLCGRITSPKSSNLNYSMTQLNLLINHLVNQEAREERKKIVTITITVKKKRRRERANHERKENFRTQKSDTHIHHHPQSNLQVHTLTDMTEYILASPNVQTVVVK